MKEHIEGCHATLYNGNFPERCNCGYKPQTFGIYAMSRAELKAAYERAMQARCYATAERIAFQMNEPGKPYAYPCRAKAKGNNVLVMPRFDMPENNLAERQISC